jgi:hypothetical protein
MDEATKIMWQNMIIWFKKILLKTWSTHRQKNDFNPNDPKQCCIILLCEIFI